VRGRGGVEERRGGREGEGREGKGERREEGGEERGKDPLVLAYTPDMKS